MKLLKILKYTVVVFAIVSLLAMGSSCSSGQGVSNDVKQAEKMQDKSEEETIKEYEAAVKKHRKKQSDYAKQLMKDMKKQQKANNKIRRRSVWERWFGEKCPTN